MSKVLIPAALFLLSVQAVEAQPAADEAQPAGSERSMGSADLNVNLILDAQPQGVRMLPPVRLYTGGKAGFDAWPGKVPGVTEVDRNGTLFNVTDPSYQAFLPQKARATRSAVIIAPGGGFRQLSINSEGNDVARWLAARGIAAFVLKYRLVQQKGPAFSMMARWGELDMDVSGAPAVADGAEVIRQVRAQAAEYDIDPARIVFIGFSAGAHVAAHQALNGDVAARPNYAALIYGAPFGKVPEIPPVFVPGTVIEAPPSPIGFNRPPQGTPNPAALPPLFMAISQDDFVAGAATMRFFEMLQQAGYKPEVHLFANGVHGYGLNETKSSSRHFIEAFYWWMETLGLTRKPGDPDMKAAPFILPAQRTP